MKTLTNQKIMSVGANMPLDSTEAQFFCANAQTEWPDLIAWAEKARDVLSEFLDTAIPWEVPCIDDCGCRICDTQELLAELEL